MTNPEKILFCLDQKLSEPVTLTVYGRAAIALAFPGRTDVASTLDVDVIVPTVDVAALDANEAFWSALDATNEALDRDGLYLTHIFLEEQVILRPAWLEKRVPIELKGLERLSIYRPSIPDLVLTKMMRVDPQDREDIRFLMEKEPHTPEFWAQSFSDARVPQLVEIQEAFEQTRSWILGELLA